MKFGLKKDKRSPQGEESAQNVKKGSKNIVLTPSVVVLCTYFLLLFSKIIDITLINREN